MANKETIGNTGLPEDDQPPRTRMRWLTPYLEQVRLAVPAAPSPSAPAPRHERGRGAALPLHIGGLILRLTVHRWEDQQEANHIFIFIMIAFCFVPVTAVWMQAQSQAPKPRLKPP